MKNLDAVLYLCRYNARVMRLSVTDWRQEEYHGGYSYIYVTGVDGENYWELWQWNDLYLKIESGHDILDRLIEQGLTKVMVYRAMSAFAKCVMRGKTFQELKNYKSPTI